MSDEQVTKAASVPPPEWWAAQESSTLRLWLTEAAERESPAMSRAAEAELMRRRARACSI